MEGEVMEVLMQVEVPRVIVLECLDLCGGVVVDAFDRRWKR